MKVTVIGTDHVGLVAAACFAELGHSITCFEPDGNRCSRLLGGVIEVKEPGLEISIKESVQSGRLQFKQNLADALVDAAVCILATGELEEVGGETDAGAVIDLAKEVALSLSGGCLLVVKSTVPVGTTDMLASEVAKVLESHNRNYSIDVASNPEFMRQGRSIEDFLEPDRIVVGVNTPSAKAKMSELYQSFTRNRDKMLFMGIRDAEMTKYASSAMLATRISLMNELASLAELLDVDIEQVRKGIGSDSRIGYSFIYPGCGYGGASFPRNIRNLIQVAEKNDFQPTLLKAVDSRNQAQKQKLLDKVLIGLGADRSEKTVAVWGLAFRPGVADITESTAIYLVQGLLDAGVKVRAYDPVCNELTRAYFGESVINNGQLVLANHQYDALVDADLLTLVTEWRPFQQPDFYAVKNLLKQPVIIDGRNQYDPASLAEQGFQYTGIGRPQI